MTLGFVLPSLPLSSISCYHEKHHCQAISPVSPSQRAVITRPPVDSIRTAYHEHSHETLNNASGIWKQPSSLHFLLPIIPLNLLPPFDIQIVLQPPNSIPINPTDVTNTLHNLLSQQLPPFHPLRSYALNHNRLQTTTLALLWMLSQHLNYLRTPNSSTRTRLRIALLDDVQCPRWHMDKVKMRGICTLVGKGTMVRDQEEIQNDSEVRMMEESRAVFLRGIGEEWGEAGDVKRGRKRAALHKSPVTEEGEKRLILQTDVFFKDN